MSIGSNLPFVGLANGLPCLPDCLPLRSGCLCGSSLKPLRMFPALDLPPRDFHQGASLTAFLLPRSRPGLTRPSRGSTTVGDEGA